MANVILSARKQRSGFTLIELMIVVAVVGILAAIAIPQFAHLAQKSKEASTKGNLGTLRSALSIYFGDNESQYPIDDLSSLVISQKYLMMIPPAVLPMTSNNTGHVNANGVQPGIVSNITDGALSDGWLYDNTGVLGLTWGEIVVNCSHKDMNGNFWTSY